MEIGVMVKITGNGSQGIRHYADIGDIGVVNGHRRGMFIDGKLKEVNAYYVEVKDSLNAHISSRWIVAHEDLEVYTISNDKTCYIEGCSKPVKARNLCDMHYARKLRTGSTNLNKPDRGSIKTCLVIGCEKKHKAHGYCDRHAKNFREAGSPYIPKIIKLCGVEGCNKKHWGRGMCEDHFREWRKATRKHGLNQ